MPQCSRNGCTKQLRKDNSKGVCSSNCESPEAPPNKQVAGVKRAPATTSERRAASAPAKEQGDHAAVFAKFRTVADTLGLDSEAILAEAAQGWLDAVRETVQAADSDKE